MSLDKTQTKRINE